MGSWGPLARGPRVPHSEPAAARGFSVHCPRDMHLDTHLQAHLYTTFAIFHMGQRPRVTDSVTAHKILTGSDRTHTHTYTYTHTYTVRPRGDRHFATWGKSQSVAAVPPSKMDGSSAWRLHRCIAGSPWPSHPPPSVRPPDRPTHLQPDRPPTACAVRVDGRGGRAIALHITRSPTRLPSHPPPSVRPPDRPTHLQPDRPPTASGVAGGGPLHCTSPVRLPDCHPTHYHPSDPLTVRPTSSPTDRQPPVP